MIPENYKIDKVGDNNRIFLRLVEDEKNLRERGIGSLYMEREGDIWQIKLAMGEYAELMLNVGIELAMEDGIGFCWFGEMTDLEKDIWNKIIVGCKLENEYYVKDNIEYLDELRSRGKI